ncbi:hypothetical protein EGS47_12710 [Acinetobacter sp. FDAARGOS_515]|nr:hypothetical protein EGS47_12710 [Acinetobacter sp. FDAARGOS_515]
MVFDMTAKHEPTEKTRAKVKALASVGTTRNEIAANLGVDYKTLMKHYSEQLMGTASSASAMVAQQLLKKASTGDSAAAMFWLKEQTKRSDNKVHIDNAEDPLEFLKEVWKNNDLDLDVRLSAARSALPYVHGKVAEKGKKETKADEAKQATNSGKFATLSAQLKS